MSESPTEAPASLSKNCVACSAPLVEGGKFCPNCGTRVVPASMTSAIDAYIQNKVNQELSSRLKDQDSLVREIGDKAEDVVWRRLKQYGVIIGGSSVIILALIAFVGIKKLGDVQEGVQQAVTARLEPVVSAAEQRAQAAQRTIDTTATRIDAVNASLDRLSHDVDAQTQRVAEKGNEISQKLENLDATANSMSEKLSAAEKALESRVEQISKQADIVSINQAYPTLGQPRFVTYEGRPWKGAAAKGPNEKWINIYVDPLSMGNFSKDQFQQLIGELKSAGYTSLPGMFGVGGPTTAGLGALGDSYGTALFYFKRDAQHMAQEASDIISRVLSIKSLKPTFVDPSAFPNIVLRRFVIENSGLDLQLVLLNRT